MSEFALDSLFVIAKVFFEVANLLFGEYTKYRQQKKKTIAPFSLTGPSQSLLLPGVAIRQQEVAVPAFLGYSFQVMRLIVQLAHSTI